MFKTQLHPNDFLASLEAAGLPYDEIRFLSFLSGFQQRKGGEIDAVTFLTVLLKESINGTPSYNDLASKLEASENISVSKQVLIQDSTIFRLPVRLFANYSGVANANSRVCNARIQVVYDLLAGEFVIFSIDSYSKSDVVVAPELELRKGDLVLRDRGDLTYDEIQRHIDAGADCIYRHKSQSTYMDPETGQTIDLLARLKRDGRIDMEVQLNNPSKTRVRLVVSVASPLDG